MSNTWSSSETQVTTAGKISVSTQRLSYVNRSSLALRLWVMTRLTSVREG